LPDPEGPLSDVLPSSTIKGANDAVLAVSQQPERIVELTVDSAVVLVGVEWLVVELVIELVVKWLVAEQVELEKLGKKKNSCVAFSTSFEISLLLVRGAVALAFTSTISLVGNEAF